MTTTILDKTTAMGTTTTITERIGHAFEARSHWAYTGLRILAGVLFAFHGAQGLFGWFLPPGIEIEVGSQVWIGKIIELVTGLLIASGIGARAAAFLASGTMAVAYIQFHWQLALDERLLPAVNQGELALLYSVLFLYIACRGTRLAAR